MNAPLGENAISISDEALRRLAGSVEAACPAVAALPARIVGGRRWAALPGAGRFDLPLRPPERIRLSAEAGLIVYGFADLNDAQRIKLFALLRAEGFDGRAAETR